LATSGFEGIFEPMNAIPASQPIPPEWLAEFQAAGRRPLEQRWRYAFIKTYKPVLDDARFRSFDSMQEYRDWCEAALPSWLGYGRV
jgi:hypothetical protein